MPRRPTDELRRYRRRWSRFPPDALGIRQWSGQRRIFDAIQRHHWVAVKSGHKTGKTHLTASLVLTFLSIYPNSRVITTANTERQVRENVWGEIRSQHARARRPLRGQLGTMSWRLGPRWSAIGMSTNQPDSFQGAHADDEESGRVLVIFDECQDIPMDIWTAARSMVSGRDGYWLVIANPTRVSGPFFEACHSPEWQVETLSCLDHPNIRAGEKIMPGVTVEEVEKWRTYGEDSPEWACRVLGEFPDVDDYGLISLRSIIESAGWEMAEEETHMGVDIARFGRDSNVACILQDRTVVAIHEWRGADTMETTGRVLELAERHSIAPECVHIDVIGVGSGVVDRCHEQGCGVDPVNFGAGAEHDWDHIFGVDVKFKNRRAELYWAARELFHQRQLSVPDRPEFRILRTDLTAPTWKPESDRRIAIEPKDAIKKRIGRSPDHGDAFILALSRVGSIMPQMRAISW